VYVAQIRHKLTRREEGREDLLTSNVFGLWKYLPVETGLLQFLNTATNLQGGGLGVEGDAVLNRIDFWPYIQEGDAKSAEPDVVMELLWSGKRHLVFIESKYLSGKSSESNYSEKRPTDQLAREMQNLSRLASRKGFEKYSLVYVTADTALPKEDIVEAAGELSEKTVRSEEANFYWTTWRRLPDILTRAAEQCEPLVAGLLNDLGAILGDMGLIVFSGIGPDEWTEWGTPYVFTEAEVAFAWIPIDLVKKRYMFVR